jgi:Protein of unknown function (DUF1559)
MSRRRKTGWVVVLGMATASCGLFLPCSFPTIRDGEGWVYSANSLRQIAIATENYHDTFDHLPADIMSAEGTPLLSWRVALLPFLEQANLYEEFRLDEPWDSEHNKKLLEKMPRVYRTWRDLGGPPYVTQLPNFDRSRHSLRTATSHLGRFS